MTDTIAAIATPPGRGGVGIIRLSGPKARDAVLPLLAGPDLWPSPRHARLLTFHDRQGHVLDEGLLLHFPAPHSFTGEDVVELQVHGGPVILDLLLAALLAGPVRLARPGEFSERAFLNDKLDLVQAEAIADLIAAGSEQAARSAMASLQGEFSRIVNRLLEALITLRLHVEAAIDFPEEEIDFLADGMIADQLASLRTDVDQVLAHARQGSLMREGLRLVIAGRPNAGKSSLLNALAGRDVAIVTPVAGTTRDVLREHIHLDGLPLHVIDTAGLRDSDDPVEQEGIRRARQELALADHVLVLMDAADATGFVEQVIAECLGDLPKKMTLVRNKCDLAGLLPGSDQTVVGEREVCRLTLSATTGAGMDLLRDHLKQAAGFQAPGAGSFSARRRHVEALEETRRQLASAHASLHERQAGELVAEDLRRAQDSLSEITGAFSPNDLLGRIFSSFCIGK